MHPPVEDELKDNPIHLWTPADKLVLYANETYDFKIYARALPGSELQPIDTTEHLFGQQTNRLNAAAEEIRKIEDRQAYDEHTDLVHDYFRNPTILQNYFICRNKAFLKMGEIYDMVFPDLFNANEIRSFHMCEGPGYFIEATYLAWLRNERIRKSEGKVDQKWEWNANTLNPYFENISCFDKLVDDSHIRGHMEHWFFGDSDDGDIRGITEDYLVNNGLAGSFDLVTADGSRNTQGQEGELEELVHDIIESEVRLALKLLRTNGRFVLKCYRFCHKPTRDLVLILAENFENIMAIKPLASRPGSSERYLICEGFGGRTDINPYLLLHCDEFFLKKQISRIEWHVNTFNQGPVSHYSWEERQQFLDVQKRRLFTAESVAHRAKIQQMFPQGNARDTSPWSSLYGHNLLRRLEDPVLVENAVLNFVNTYRMIPPGESPLQFEMMAQYCLCRELLVVTSRIPLVIEDTLFMEPIAFRALKDWKPKIYCDLFEYHSTLNYTTEEDWRRFWLTQNGHFMLEFVPQITIEHVLIAIAQGMDMNMQSFTLTNLPMQSPPLFLSRVSASFYCLLYAIFENIEFGQRQIRWSGLRTVPYLRELVQRLILDMSRYPRGYSVRSFIPLHVIDVLHHNICYYNVAHLTRLWDNRL